MRLRNPTAERHTVNRIGKLEPLAADPGQEINVNPREVYAEEIERVKQFLVEVEDKPRAPVKEDVAAEKGKDKPGKKPTRIKTKRHSGDKQ